MPAPVSYRGAPVYGDHNAHELMGDGAVVIANGEPRQLFAAFPRNYGRHKYGSLPFAPRASFPLIPRSEWKDRWEEKVRQGTTLRQRAEAVMPGGELLILDQDGLNYCHAYALVSPVMHMNAINGLPFRELSAGSVGGPVTNYRNDGAWCGDDIAWASEHGIAGTEFVPMDAVRRNAWRPGASEDALKTVVHEWEDLPQRSMDHTGSGLLQDFPIYFGNNRMGHAMWVIGMVWIDGELAWDTANSWGPGWGKNGCAYFLAKSRTGTPDEQYALRSISPNMAA